MEHFTGKNAVWCLMLAQLHSSPSVLERDKMINLVDEFRIETTLLICVSPIVDVNIEIFWGN
jgi:hypothetical protein